MWLLLVEVIVVAVVDVIVVVIVVVTVVVVVAVVVVYFIFFIYIIVEGVGPIPVQFLYRNSSKKTNTTKFRSPADSACCC